MGETSHGNRYLEGVKSIAVLLVQTHFTTVKKYVLFSGTEMNCQRNQV